MSKKFNKAAAFLSVATTKGLGPVTIKKLIDFFNDMENVFSSCPESIAKKAEIDIYSAREIKKALSNLSIAQGQTEKAIQKGYRLYFYGDGNYPSLLKEIHDPPPVLYSRGRLIKSDYNSIAVVGTRKASSYGKAAAAMIARRLASYDITVVSGAAVGVDTAAHRAALEAGGRTIAVMGGGLDRPYPRSNINLLRKISSSGAVVSEFAPETKPVPVNFPRRNRIISGLSHGVVVVQAPAGSGALITASFAAEQGRQVYAVPGSVFSSASAGCLRLIKDGAVPVSRADEIIEDIRGQFDSSLLKSRRNKFEKEKISEGSRNILKILSSQPLHVDIIKNKLKMDISFLASELTSLEIKGRVKKVDGEKYIKVNNE